VSREKSAADPKDAKNKSSTQVVEAAKPISLALMTDRDFEVTERAADHVFLHLTTLSPQELKKLRVPDLKIKLRQIGVEPDDFPDCTERNDLIDLFKKKYDEKSQENKEIKRQKELMKMSLPVSPPCPRPRPLFPTDSH
jgi:hypothetical protein